MRRLRMTTAISLPGLTPEETTVRLLVCVDRVDAAEVLIEIEVE